jgi:hypothetical protein
MRLTVQVKSWDKTKHQKKAGKGHLFNMCEMMNPYPSTTKKE